MENRKSLIAKIAILAVVAVFSFFWLSNYATDADNFHGTLSSLDDKTTTVMELTAGSAAASAAISLIPGDGGTPVAEKLADLSGYFLIILAAIMIEKWLVTITGLLAFKIIIPICCIGLIALLFFRNDSLKAIFIKLICFALMIFAVVPFSVILSNTIDDSYQATVERTINDANDSSQNLQENAGGDQDENAVTKFFNTVKGGIASQIDKFEGILSNFVESIAVLLVTTCAIPLAVLAFFGWLIKLLTGVELKFPRFSKLRQARA